VLRVRYPQADAELRGVAVERQHPLAIVL
jgi:hypothetical protein